MKYLAMFFLMIQGMMLNSQNDTHSQLINQFLNVVKSKENTMKCLFEKNVIEAPDSINSQGESSYKFYQAILNSLSDQLRSCESQETTYEVIVMDKPQVAKKLKYCQLPMSYYTIKLFKALSQILK